MTNKFYKLRPNLSSPSFYLLFITSVCSSFRIRLIPLLTVVSTIEKSRRDVENKSCRQVSDLQGLRL